MNDIDDNFDDLEAELKQLPPALPSAELEQRIAMELKPEPLQSQTYSHWRNLVLALAASVLIAIALWQFRTTSQPEIVDSISVPPVTEKLEFVAEKSPTSWAAYRSATFDSPEALASMLESDATFVLPASAPINLAQLYQ